MTAINIYQIEPSLDLQRALFCSLDQLKAPPDPSVYRCVFSGKVETDDLEEIYRIFNVCAPPGYQGRSLSVSDIVEVVTEEGAEAYYTDSIGFKRIEFDSSQTNQMERIRALLCQNQKRPVEVFLLDDPRAFCHVLEGEGVHLHCEDDIGAFVNSRNRSVLFVKEDPELGLLSLNDKELDSIRRSYITPEVIPAEQPMQF